MTLKIKRFEVCKVHSEIHTKNPLLFLKGVLQCGCFVPRLCKIQPVIHILPKGEQKPIDKPFYRLLVPCIKWVRSDDA